jgi:hypothetical protein
MSFPERNTALEHVRLILHPFDKYFTLVICRRNAKTFDLNLPLLLPETMQHCFYWGARLSDYLKAYSISLKLLWLKVLQTIRLCQQPDGDTSPKYKLLCFITTKKFCQEKNALAFNRDRCCHLVLCLQLIPFH